MGQGSPLLSLPLPPSHGPACWLEGDFLGHSEEECAKHSLGIETHPSLRKTPNPSLLWSGEVSDQKGGAGAAEFTLNQSGHPASAHFLPPLKPTYFLSGWAEGKAGTGSLRGQQPSSCFLGCLHHRARLARLFQVNRSQISIVSSFHFQKSVSHYLLSSPAWCSVDTSDSPKSGL